MSKRVFALLLAALLTAGLLGAPTASASIFSQDVPVSQADDDFPLVSGLLELLERPGPQLQARTLAAATSNISFDGGLTNDAFVLHCSTLDAGNDKLRVRWSDAAGDHTWTVLRPLEAPQCADGETQSYDGVMLGTCDGALSAANVGLVKNSDGTQTGSIQISGGCNLDDGSGGAASGEAQGCLSFGSDGDACDNGSSGGGTSFPGHMTGSATVNGVTFQFDLECNAPAVGDNLTVTWDANTFELTDFGSPGCHDENSYTASNKKNPFDTQRGHGSGTCNGVATVAGWTFEDAGEPSSADSAAIEIDPSGACPGLDIEGPLSAGNLQAHPD